MTEKRNCWEIKDCGREPGGKTAELRGVCPAAVAQEAHGLNNGINGGRICWAISGTYCDGIAHGSFAENRLSCMSCEVFNTIREEEGIAAFNLLLPGQLMRASKSG